MQEPIFIKDFLPQHVLNVLYSYIIIKYTNEDSKFDIQTNSLVGCYKDYLAETILDISTSVVSENVNKKLFPSYSYLRVYDKGSDLPIHVDRPSCEYTVALCVGALPYDVPYDIFVGEADSTSDYKYFDEKRNLIPLKINYKFSMLPNNALIFKGMDSLHWREHCSHDHFITIFLHYVDQEGPYSEYRFDKKQFLGSTV